VSCLLGAMHTTYIIFNHCGNLKFLSIIMELFGGVNIDGNSRTSLSSASNSFQGKQHHVEIATLSMPQSATGCGVEAGDGVDFVLEANAHVIDQMVENDNLGQSQNSNIEGVIDLQFVSYLVSGVSEGEFVSLLQQDLNHAHHSEANTKQRTTLETIDEGKRVMNNDDDKRMQASGSNEPEHKDENVPFLNSIITEASTGCIVLSADPFLQTIADAHDHKDGDVTSMKSSFSRSPEINTLAQNNQVDRIAFTREAFLLSIPTTGIPGDSDFRIAGSYQSGSGAIDATDNMFVLALPEMAIVSKDDADSISYSNDTLRTSATSAGNTVTAVVKEEVLPFLEHAFASLPTDVRRIELRVTASAIHEDTKPNEKEVHLDVVVDRKVPLIGYILLVSGLVALSSVGVALDLQHGPSACMKTYWRFSATAVVFFFLSSKSFKREEFSKFSPMELFVWMPFAGINYSFMCTAFVVALDLTSLVNAFILSNLASLIIIGSKFALGVPVLLFEGLGALIGLFGAFICASASSGPDDQGGESNSRLVMVGNILAFLASVSTALYLTVAKKLRPKVDLFLFMFLLFSLASLFLLVYMKVSGEAFEFSFHPEIGTFGWMNPVFDRLPLELYMAIICNGVGTTGYIAIMKYFDPVVVTMVMLMEPIVASFIGAAVGVSTLPGWVTWAGDAVVAVGSIMVISSGSKKTESIDATEALHGMDREVDKGAGLTNSFITKSPKLLRRSDNDRKSSFLMKSPLFGSRYGVNKSPIFIKSPQVLRDSTVYGEDEIEFKSVKSKQRAASVGGCGNRIVWT